MMSEQVEVTEEGLREALREVVDPEIGMNVIELGLIRDIEIHEDRGHMTMIMTTPFCPYAPQLLEQTRRTAQNYLRRPTLSPPNARSSLARSSAGSRKHLVRSRCGWKLPALSTAGKKPR